MKSGRIRYIMNKMMDIKGIKTLFSGKGFRLFSTVFFVIIFIPFFTRIFNLGEEGSRVLKGENRLRVEPPVLRINSVFPFFKKYEDYFNDSFSFRYPVIHLFNRLKFDFLRVSPVDSVLLGKEGWLFLSRENKVNLLKYYFSIVGYGDRDMERVGNWLKKRKSIAESMGCRYIYVIVPNKQTVYPEMMPSGADKNKDVPMLSSCIDYLKREGLDFIPDLQDEFREAGKAETLYHKTDTHWNQLGAYKAYRSILTFMSKLSGLKIKPESIRDFRIIKKDQPGGDLARMLSLEKNVFRENMLFMERVKKLPLKVKRLRPLTVKKDVDVYENRVGKLSSIIVIHDSFGEYLKNFIPADFKKSYFSTDRNLNRLKNMIIENGIRFMVEEIAERYFLRKLSEK